MAVRGFQPWADELAALQTENFEVHPEQCVRVRHRQARCTRCADFCPTGAIQIGTALKVVPLRCAQCGLCLAACPTGVFGPKRPGDADIMAGLERAAQRSEQVVFACSLLLRKHRRMRSHPGLVELDCLGRLHESLLVGAVAAGARDVVLSDGLCARCTYEVGRKLANGLVASTRTLLDALGMEAAVRFSEQALPGMPALQDRGTERAAAPATGPAGSWSRGQADGPPGLLTRLTGGSGRGRPDTAAVRRWEAILAGNGPGTSRPRSSFDTSEREPGEPGDDARPAFGGGARQLPVRMPPKRRLLLHFLRSFGARLEPGPALPASRPRLAAGQGPFGAIEASNACTGCTMCAYFCPTGALERREEDGEIVLSHDPSSCTACGLCVDICYRHALRFVEVDPVRAVSGARDVLWRGRFNSPEERLKQAVLQRFSTSV